MNLATFKQVDSGGELEEILRQGKGSLIGDAKSPGNFYIIEYPGGSSGVPIGLAAEYFGIEPTAIFDPQEKSLTVAHGRTVSRIKTQDGGVIFNVDFPSPIYEIVRLEKDGSSVVLHEIGLAKVAPTGKPAWEFSASDVIEGHSISGDLITLNTADGKTHRVSLVSGMEFRNI